MPAILTQMVYLKYRAGAPPVAATYKPIYRARVNAQTKHRVRVEAQNVYRARARE